MKNPILTLLASLMLTACAASTPQAAREMGADRRYVFAIDADYQTAYRRILEAARNCYQGQVITATMLVNGDLYPDSRAGTVSVGMYGIASSVYQVIDIQGLDGARSEIKAIFPVGPVEKMGAKVKGWATGTSAEC